MSSSDLSGLHARTLIHSSASSKPLSHAHTLAHMYIIYIRMLANSNALTHTFAHLRANPLAHSHTHATLLIPLSRFQSHINNRFAFSLLFHFCLSLRLSEMNLRELRLESMLARCVLMVANIVILPYKRTQLMLVFTSQTPATFFHLLFSLKKVRPQDSASYVGKKLSKTK